MPDYLSSTVIPPSIPEDDASAAKKDGRPSELTYGDLLPHVEERRLSAPGRARDPAKVASNTRRDLGAFMEANELAETSPVGAELLGAGLEEALSKLSALGAARDTRLGSCRSTTNCVVADAPAGTRITVRQLRMLDPFRREPRIAPVDDLCAALTGDTLFRKDTLASVETMGVIREGPSIAVGAIAESW